MTSKVTNGQTYTTNVWMRTQSGSPTGKVTLAQGAVNSSGWTLLSGTATVTWTGTLSNARFYVETIAGADNTLIDDASMQ